jgi:hypothetical protein
MRRQSHCPPILFLFLSSFAIADFSLSALCACHLSLSPLFSLHVPSSSSQRL